MKFVLIAFLLLTSLGLSQSASEVVSPDPQPRIAAVTRKDGSVFKGKLVRQDENAVVLESDGMTLTIPMDSVANINLDPAESIDFQPQLKQALQSLRNLLSAAEVGIAYRDYGAMLIGVKTDVVNSLDGVPPEAKGKAEIESTLKEYEFAGRIWNSIWQEDFLYLMNLSREDKAAFEGYGVPVRKQMFYKVYYKNEILSAIWRKAGCFFNQAQLAINSTGSTESSDPAIMSHCSKETGSPKESVTEGPPIETGPPARIIFYRHKGMNSTAINPEIVLRDKTPVAKLTKGKFFAMTVAPGRYFFTLTNKSLSKELFP